MTAIDPYGPYGGPARSVRRTPVLVTAGLAVAAACAAPAQRPVVAPGPLRPAPPKPALTFQADLAVLSAGDDIAFVAEVSAREVRFEVVPINAVTFSTTLGGRRVWTGIRDNLPRPVQPGVTYRDVRARVVIATSLPSVEQALEALDRQPLPPAAVSPVSTAPGDP
jgi:hypothetical protein